MATKKKMLMSAAGSAGGEALNVEDVFSTYLTNGTNFATGFDYTQDLENLIWVKSRSGAYDHRLFTKGAFWADDAYLVSNSTAGATSSSPHPGTPSYNDGSFVLQNLETTKNVAFSFRKAPKFFDVVTYTGTGSAQNISHDLGSVPGMIIAKRTDSTGSWITYHRSLGNDKYLLLQETNAAATGAAIWDGTTPTDSVFTVGALSGLNLSGATYVAYIFAHNNGDGEFGPDGDADIIKCGSYTGGGSSDVSVDLGFEPQWLLIKTSSRANEWMLVDTMRGAAVEGDEALFTAESSNAEFTGSNNVNITPTGFDLVSSDSRFNDTGHTYIYIAIRRGTKVPESATEVFAATNMSSSTLANTGFAVDLSIDSSRTSSSSNFVNDRLRGSGVYMNTDGTTAEQTGGSRHFDSNQGVIYTSGFTGINWSWKRAPGYFDAVAYTGNGTAGRTVSHNLGVAPEMMWVKHRDQTRYWPVYHKDVGNNRRLELNSTTNDLVSSEWNSTTPTATEFTLGADAEVNGGGANYIAYLFASLDGISKLGSFTISSGQSSVVDCGFSSGARFVLIKRTDGSDYWWVFDTERGITVSSSPGLRLDVTNEESSDTYLTPNSSGFATVAGYFPAGDYIFYAIA